MKVYTCYRRDITGENGERKSRKWQREVEEESRHSSREKEICRRKR